MSMNPEIRDQWVAALESGEFAQTKQVLTRVNPDGTEAHCCLGVLSALAVAAGVCERVMVHESDNSVAYGTVHYSSAALPPMSVQKWAGLDEENPSVDYSSENGDRHALAELNDSEGLTFPEIAKLIKEQL